MKKFTILIPVYNDWTSVFILLKNIDALVATWDAEVSVLIINDASSDSRPENEIIFGLRYDMLCFSSVSRIYLLGKFAQEK